LNGLAHDILDTLDHFCIFDNIASQIFATQFLSQKIQVTIASDIISADNSSKKIFLLSAKLNKYSNLFLLGLSNKTFILSTENLFQTKPSIYFISLFFITGFKDIIILCQSSCAKTFMISEFFATPFHLFIVQTSPPTIHITISVFHHSSTNVVNHCIHLILFFNEFGNSIIFKLPAFKSAIVSNICDKLAFCQSLRGAIDTHTTSFE